jgi:hypothetical protein
VERVSSWLKAFVVGGGVLVLGGTILLVVLLVSRATTDQGEDTAVAGRPVELVLPAGATVHEVVPDGRNRVLLLGTGGDGRQFIAVVDPVTGERLSLVHILTEDR